MRRSPRASQLALPEDTCDEVHATDGYASSARNLGPDQPRGRRRVPRGGHDTCYNLLDRYYGCDAASLLAAMRSVPNHRDSWAPTTLDHRYVLEDVQCTLVPLCGLARKAGVAVPIVDAIVHISCALAGEDLWRRGRTLEKLGWADRTHQEILSWIRS